MGHIRIDDMEAIVFKAMIHFIYDDTLFEIETRHLLVATNSMGWRG